MMHAGILAVLLWCTVQPLGAQECTRDQPVNGAAYRVHARTRVADRCTPALTDAHVLQVIEPFCVRQKLLFTACPSVTAKASRVLEWSGINRLAVWPPEMFRRAAAGAVWYNGTSFGSYLGQFPHSVQGLMPLLNLPAMGMPPQRFVQLPARDNFPEGHGLEHPYTHSLLLALCACQGLGPDQVVGQRAWWAERRSTVVCFERMVVPIIRYTPCGHVFVEPRWAGGLMRSFKQHLYGAFGIPVAPAPLRTITYLHRAQNRRITNRDEVLQMLSTFGFQVSLLETEKDKPFPDQVRDLSTTGVLVTTHGANCVNGMFLPDGAVLLEAHLHPFWIPCYWGQFLAKVGVSYLRWCHQTDACALRDWPTAYPRDDAVVDVEKLKAVVARAVHMVKEGLVCAYTSTGECVPRRPPPGGAAGTEERAAAIRAGLLARRRSRRLGLREGEGEGDDD